jgi:hypothetical protein
VAGQRQVGVDGDPARAVELRPRRAGERRGESGRLHSRGPDHGAGRHAARFAPALVLDRHAVLVHADHEVAQHRRDADPLERSRRPLRQLRRERRQDAVRLLDQQHATLARVGDPEVARQRVARQLADLPGHLDTRGPGADDDEGEPRRAPRGVLLQLGRLERLEDATAHVERALE